MPPKTLKQVRGKLQLSKLEADKQLLSHDIDLTELSFITRRLPAMRFEQAVVSADITRTIEGASTVKIVVNDHYGLIKNSGRLARNVDIKLDGLWFRLCQFSKSGDNITLTFESREVAVLRTYNNKRVAGWGQLSRARFAQILINEVKEMNIQFVCPELKKTKWEKNKSKADKFRDREPGFGSWNDALAAAKAGGKPVTIKGQTPVTEQLLTVEAVLDTGHNLGTTGQMAGITRKILVCSIMTIIQEATAYNRNSGDRDSVGAFQQRPSQGWGTVAQIMDIQHAATSFFDRATKYNQSNPNSEYWEVCQAVQRSAFPKAYAQWRLEAERLVTAYGIAGGDTSTNKTTAAANLMGEWEEDSAVDKFQFMRGRPKTVAGGKKKWEKEDSWTCLNRLAEEVQWRCFEVSGKIYFISEPRLFKSAPRARLSEGTEGVDWVDFDYDINKKNGKIDLVASLDRWEAPPGTIIEIFDSGIANGRWIVSEVNRSLFETVGKITLKKPRPKLPEPKKEDLTGLWDNAAQQPQAYVPTPGYDVDPPGQYPSGRALRDAVLNSPNITFIRDSQKNDIKFGLVNPIILRFMLAFTEAGFPIKVTSMRTDHSTGSNHTEGKAVDFGNYGRSNPQTRAAQLWIINHRIQLKMNEIIGPYDELCYPLGAYDQKTLAGHEDHIHAGFDD